jgi:hypothetical protein
MKLLAREGEECEEERSCEECEEEQKKLLEIEEKEERKNERNCEECEEEQMQLLAIEDEEETAKNVKKSMQKNCVKVVCNCCCRCRSVTRYRGCTAKSTMMENKKERGISENWNNWESFSTRWTQETPYWWPVPSRTCSTWRTWQRRCRSRTGDA